MIAKIICPLLLLAGFINFSSSSTTDKPYSETFSELHFEAITACEMNSTVYFFDRFKTRECALFKSECICPIACYVHKLGIVNDGGLNKIVVNWIRTLMDLLNASNIEEPHRFPKWASNRTMEAIFYESRKFVDPLSSACSLKNETAFEVLVTKIAESIEEQSEKENPDDFIPSKEDSPMLELILNATDTCSTKFNASSFSIVMDMVKHSPRHLENRVFCYIHCMLSKLDIVNETELNEPWAEILAGDLITKLGKPRKEYMAVINDGLILINSKCSAEFNELPDNYLFGVVRDIFEVKFDAVDRKIASDRVHERQSL